MDSGNAVREAINQGFTRAELGSLADKQATQVYHGAKAEGTVVASKCTNAIENYQAAVACFLRALPSLTDQRSADLVRAEIRRLLARLGELKKILRETDPTNDLLAGEAEIDPTDSMGGEVKNRLLQDLRFNIGDEVEVDEYRPAKIISIDLEQGTYGVEYDDGTREVEHNVIESRVRSRPILSKADADTTSMFSSLNEQERHRLWSEIVESERAYQFAMQHLVNSYIIPLDSPSQWGGSKATGDTVFSQKPITKQERAGLFGNVEDLTGMSALVLEALETRFADWKKDQKLADVFLELSAMYLNSYPLFAETHAESLKLLQTIRRDRSSFQAVEARARMLGAPPLEDLLRLPLNRPSEMRRLLQALAQRTAEDHPDMQSIRDAFVLFGRVEEAMRLSLDRAKLEKQVAEIETQFSPALKLLKKGRYLIKFSSTLKRIEGSTRATRYVWLFNDILIVGRKSEWLSVGSFRHLGQIALVKARPAPEYGPLAFEVAGTMEKYVFVAEDEADKEEWLKALRGFIPTATHQPARRKSKSASPAKSTAAAPPPPPQPAKAANVPPPPPPPPPALPKKRPSSASLSKTPVASASNGGGGGGYGMESLKISDNKPVGVRGSGVPTAFTMATKSTTTPAAVPAQPQPVPGWGSPVPGWPTTSSPPLSTANAAAVDNSTLGAATMKQREIHMQKKRSESASPAMWYRAQAIANFEPMEIGDLAFKRGDILELNPEETSPGWSRGRIYGGTGVEGAVPTSYVQRL